MREFSKRSFCRWGKGHVASLDNAGGKLLSVPLYQQETNFWCGPASGQMMLSFVTGTLHTQTYLAGLMEVH